jgi:hypothetical protein
MNDFVERCSFHVVRRLEKTLPPSATRSVLMPWAAARAASRYFEFPVPVPDCIRGTDPARVTRWQYSPGFYLNHLLHHFPDRLASAEWQSRCRITGLEHWRKARQNGRPVVLAYCHFGPSFLLREWLRAAGLPAAPLVRGSSADRTKAKWLKNRYALLPDVPTAFFWDQLRELSRFLADGNVLLIAIDHESGRQIELPVDGDWMFRMATGAIRLAARHRAELIPCSIIDEGVWRYRIELGRPVGGNDLIGEAHWPAAGKQLLQELLAHFRIQPSQCTKKLVERFRPVAPSAGEE